MILINFYCTSRRRDIRSPYNLGEEACFLFIYLFLYFSMEDWLIKCFPQQDTHLLILLRLFIVILKYCNNKMGIYKRSCELINLFYCIHLKKWSVRGKMTEKLKYVPVEMFILGLSHISQCEARWQHSTWTKILCVCVHYFRKQNSMARERFLYKKKKFTKTYGTIDKYIHNCRIKQEVHVNKYMRFTIYPLKKNTIIKLQ